ncbi:MAG: sigma-54 dependent transcriptional regulator [Cardiobacteriaceae bacterium]|nr:sigma-54 dependent transcriptional regulator [Cardiobacteriaceae bacterium]
MNPTEILIIDDEVQIVESLRDILEDEGYVVHSAHNGSSANEQLKSLNPDLILLDIWMPDIDGISLLRLWQENDWLRSPVIVMSGHGTIETAVEATKLGAYDYLEKPLSSAKLLLTLDRARQAHQLQLQNAALKAKISPPRELIGKSAYMQQLKKHGLQWVSNTSLRHVPLLLTGATGTGKQHLAHYLHQNSPEHDNPFVFAPLSAMDSSEHQSALLGNSKRLGFIAQAQHGTLYLDEIAELSHEAQQTLLHLAQHQTYFAQDQSKQLKDSQLRLIMATRLPLTLLKEQLIPELYDILTIMHLHLLPLAEHRDDIPELLEYFSQQLADYEQLSYRHFSINAQNVLRQQTWHGNIRELRHLVQRLLIQHDDPEISAEEATQALSSHDEQTKDELWAQIIPKDLSFRDAREKFERQYLMEQFRRCDGNIARLSSLVGMDRTNLYRKLRSVNIDPTVKPKQS